MTVLFDQIIHEFDPNPKFCPFCGGKNIYLGVAEWDAESKEDSENRSVLDEHQCMDCEGRSFWS